MKISNRFPISYLFQASIIILISLVFILVVIGGLLNTDNSINGCPDWQSCLGKWPLPLNSHNSPEFLFSIITAFIALSSIPLLLITAKYYRKKYRILVPVLLFSVLSFSLVLIGSLRTNPEYISTRNYLSSIQLGILLMSLVTLLAAFMFSKISQKFLHGS